MQDLMECLMGIRSIIDNAAKIVDNSAGNTISSDEKGLAVNYIADPEIYAYFNISRR